MTKLAIVGYGKMGQMVEQLAPEFDFRTHSTVDLKDDLSGAEGADVAIEFTAPHAAVENLEALAAMRIPTVTGTTGWLEQMDRVRTAFEKHETPLVWSPNFSVGVNVFLKVVEEASRLLASESEYEAWAWEIHHSAKKDRQSGTLLGLVRAMREAGFPGHIDVASNRAGKLPGTHEIGFDSAADTITLRHTARNREGFARGALKAAQWLAGPHDSRPVGVLEFKDIFWKRGD